ncbi:MAG TPA: HAMP domain-containing histidine kinase [Corynebacteriales bacterium]|nr:HAMP domain-containing histidine kinase [Mycobacteriales bacterium]
MSQEQPQSFPNSVLERIPMRILLTVGIVLLLFGGLVASNVAITTLQWRNSINTVDNQLYAAQKGWASHPGRAMNRLENRGPWGPPSHFFLLLQPSHRDALMVNDSRAVPNLTSVVPDGNIRTVESDGVGGKWRILSYPADFIFDWEARTGPRMEEGIVTVALPLDQAIADTRNLILLQVFIGVAVLIAAGGITWLLVSKSLHPLQEVENAAQDITRGDYNRRVTLQGYDTEVENLGLAFNQMAQKVQETLYYQYESEQAARTSEANMRRFVGDASHELRTPLTAIRGFADAAKMGAVDTETALQHIGDEGVRMQQLVEDLLLLARIDNNRPMELKDIQEVDLSRLLESAVTAASISWPQRTIDLKLTDSAVVAGDETRLRQIVDNLITNALRHAGEDADILVGLRVDDARDNAFITVADNGIGMDQHTLKHVFDRFFRGDDSRARNKGERSEGRGSGLGLAIVKSLAEAHNGTVTVTSNEGEGSQFVVTLPLAQEGPAEAAGPTETDTSAKTGSANS